MLRTYVSFRSLILLFGLVAVGLPIALIGQLGIVRNLTEINMDVASVRQAQLAAAAVLQLQVDEESGIRGFAQTGKRTFLEPYLKARTQMPERLDELESRLRSGALREENLALADLRAINQQWLREVAEPVAAGAELDDRRATRGKLLIDRFRSDLLPIQRALDVRYRDDIRRRDNAIHTTTATSVAAIALIAVEVLVFGILLMRMRRELDRERAVVETLQVAVSARLVPPPHLRVGSAYRSATRGARVGGDVYDIYRLTDDSTLLVVADVSGKGLTAAVDTMFVRYAVRALASESLPPDDIARRFDALYRDANSAPESFISLFVGIHDRRDDSLTYTNAGHEACWVRHGRDVTMLAPTGPIIGLGELPFTRERRTLVPGELLFLATDGVTEARQPDGTFVTSEQLRTWIVEADASDPQRFVDSMLGLVTRWSRGRIVDDLALLAVMPFKERETPTS